MQSPVQQPLQASTWEVIIWNRTLYQGKTMIPTMWWVHYPFQFLPETDWVVNYINVDKVVPEWNGGCQSGFQGTSAAAPLAAGIIALLLEAKWTWQSLLFKQFCIHIESLNSPRLTWRDVHHLVVLSSSPPGGDENQKEAQWDINGAGLRSNVRYGFGALDADRLISLGRTWVNVPPRRQTQVYCSSLPRFDI